MPVRQYTIINRKGRKRTAWLAEYMDARGKQHRKKGFKTRREATDWLAETHTEVRRGTHVADSDSPTAEAAGKLWLATGKANGLTKSTQVQQEGHLRLHIVPFIGGMKLSQLNVPGIRAFEGQLRDAGRSAAMVRKIVTSLGSIIADAMERGTAMHNPVHEMRARRSTRRTKDTRERRRKLMVGVDIPTPAEIRAILTAAEQPGSNRFPPCYRRALFSMLALAGLRASELRGLTWANVDLVKGTVTITQRADQWGDIDVTKSEAGERTVPLPALVVNALKEWKLACPKYDTGQKDADGNAVKVFRFVFPNGAGNIENYKNLTERHWHPLQIAAGLSVPALDEDGKQIVRPVLGPRGEPVKDEAGNPIMRPVLRPKYSGLHCLRHFFASWCAARREDGGLGLPLKTVQARMGHATLAMTSDRYGHLFPATDDAEVLAAGERALMGA